MSGVRLGMFFYVESIWNYAEIRSGGRLFAVFMVCHDLQSSCRVSLEAGCGLTRRSSPKAPGRVRGCNPARLHKQCLEAVMCFDDVSKIGIPAFYVQHRYFFNTFVAVSMFQN